MNGFWEQTRVIGAGDVDVNGEWRLSGMIGAMQEAGEAHCEENGLGVRAMRGQNLAWVVTRAHLRVEYAPRMAETVTVRTWPKPPKHAFFPRYYQLLVDGRPAVSASMLYAQLDLSSRRMAGPWLGGNGELTCELPPPLPLPGTLPVVDAPAETVTRVARYSDLDINGHVNNARYVDWFCDCFPMEHHRAWRLCDALIHYDREILPDEPVALALRRGDAVSVLKGSYGGQSCFAMSGAWEKR